MKEIPLKEIAALTNSEVKGDLEIKIRGVNSLERAGDSQVTFYENPRYASQLKKTKAAAVFISPHVELDQLNGNFLICDCPSLAFQKTVELFQGPIASGFYGVHPTAVIHPSVTLPKKCTIGPFAVIDRGCRIRENFSLGAGSFIGAETLIGEDVSIHPNVTVREGCQIGNRVILQPGAVIGSCGFGYHTNINGEHEKYPHYGIVVLEDDVEIGANSTIDRARFHETRIGRGSKIDNLVQIGHQVEIGEDNLLAAQAGIAGSTKTGRHVVMGGQSGISGHITIIDNVMISAKTGVSKSITESGRYYGIPAMNEHKYKNFMVNVRNIAKTKQKVKELEEKLETLLKEHPYSVQ